MPCAVDYILEGLKENLELERELGVFSLEFDRGFLMKLPTEREAVQESEAVRRTHGAAPSAASAPSAPAASSAAPSFDFVFLHHGPVAGPGVEMMAKVVSAMKSTPERSPIVFAGEKPSAKIYVVLGTKALGRWYEGVSLAYGGWFRDVDSEVLLVYSPEDIYRFGTKLSPAMMQKKREMWSSLQEVMRKVC